MAANLTPQYHKAEQEYRRATTKEEELKWLQAMLREIPKHKSSEKLQSELKQKISRTKKEIETDRKTGKAGPGFRIVRQGAGTAVVLGAPNVGKSQLMASLTRAQPEVAPYGFTTRIPAPAMMPWNNVQVQLIDTPPVTADFLDPVLYGIIRAADVALLVVDLGCDEGIEQCQELLEHLEGTKTRLGRTSSLDERDVGLSFTRTLSVINKIDMPGAAERLELFHELCPLDFEEHVISAVDGTGLEELREAVYHSLGVIRVYTKLPHAKEADMSNPFTIPAGGTVMDVAVQVHKDFVDNLKFARVWGEQVHDGTVVKGDHVMCDRDIVELHT